MTTMTNEKVIRVTKAQRFADIKALLSGEPTAYGTDVETALGVLDNEIQILAKKNSHNSAKAKKVNEVNEKYKAMILDFLFDHPESTCSDMLKGIPQFTAEMLSTSKISALNRALIADGKVVRESVAGKAKFSLADEDEDEVEGA